MFTVYIRQANRQIQGRADDEAAPGGELQAARVEVGGGSQFKPPRLPGLRLCGRRLAPSSPPPDIHARSPAGNRSRSDRW